MTLRPARSMLGGQARTAQLLRQAEGAGAGFVGEAHDEDVRSERRRRLLAHGDGDALKAAAKADTRRRRAAELLDQPVVPAAPADGVLGGPQRV